MWVCSGRKSDSKPCSSAARPRSTTSIAKSVRNMITPKSIVLLLQSSSMLAQQAAEAVDAVGDVQPPQGVPEGDGVDGQDRLVQPALGLDGQAGERQVRAGLDDHFRVGPVQLDHRLPQAR